MTEAEAVDGLALHLKGMRAGLQQLETGDRSTWVDAKTRWSVLLDRYDTGLVQAAEAMGLPVPDAPPPTSAGQRRLDDHGRAALEQALIAAGVQL